MCVMLEEEMEKKGLALETKETAILVAAKYGVSKIVDRFLENISVAICDSNKYRKNVLLLGVENRNLEVFKLLYLRKIFRGSLGFRKWMIKATLLCVTQQSTNPPISFGLFLAQLYRCSGKSNGTSLWRNLCHQGFSYALTKRAKLRRIFSPKPTRTTLKMRVNG